MRKGLGRHNRRSAGGPVPSLVLDFAGTGILDSRITFTRSTTATYTNNSGVLTSAAANVARFDYDPSTLAPLGLLIEEQRTNVLLNSLLNGTNLTTQTVITGAVPYTLSFYGTGTIVLAGTNISTQVGTGAYPSRKTFTFTPTAGNLTLTVTGTVQYAQLEAGSFASSFIPTAGAQVTRASDNASMTGTNVSSWYNSAQGTWYSEFNINQNTVAWGLLSNQVSAGSGRIFYSNNTGVFSFDGANVGVLLGSTAVNTFYKIASSLTPTLNTNCGSGNTPTTNATNGNLLNTTTLYIGLVTSYLNGHIKKIAFYPTTLTSAQLQALTT
jgi:hypothetical protein